MMFSHAGAPGCQGLPSFLDAVEVGQLPLIYRSGGWTIRRISNPFRIDRRASGRQAGAHKVDVVDDRAGNDAAAVLRNVVVAVVGDKTIPLRHRRHYEVFLMIILLDRFLVAISAVVSYQSNEESLFGSTI